MVLELELIYLVNKRCFVSCQNEKVHDPGSPDTVYTVRLTWVGAEGPGNLW